MKVTAIILAGGKNLRLGKNKALETIGGKSIIERVIERLRPLASQMLIVTSAEGNHLPGAGGVEFLTDLYPAYGPLGGIYTGLVAARSSHSLVVACDMPFLNTSLLGYMIEQAADFDAVVPRLDGDMIEPLHAVYSASCLEKIKERLERKQLSVNQFVRTLRVWYIEKAEIQRFDPELLSFFNINYPDDLERAKTIAAREKATRKTG
jgi:molybdopterin-guanine dinucleotide biosynthesis protein A